MRRAIERARLWSVVFSAKKFLREIDGAEAISAYVSVFAGFAITIL